MGGEWGVGFVVRVCRRERPPRRPRSPQSLSIRRRDTAACPPSPLHPSPSPSGRVRGPGTPGSGSRTCGRRPRRLRPARRGGWPRQPPGRRRRRPGRSAGCAWRGPAVMVCGWGGGVSGAGGEGKTRRTAARRVAGRGTVGPRPPHTTSPLLLPERTHARRDASGRAGLWGGEGREGGGGENVSQAMGGPGSACAPSALSPSPPHTSSPRTPRTDGRKALVDSMAAGFGGGRGRGGRPNKL